MFGFDIVSVILVAGFITFWGVAILMFVLFYNKNPYMPRKYYKVRLFDREGKELGMKKGWIISEHKVKWFRIGLKGFPSFKGVEKDIAIMETMNAKGEIEIIEDVPDKYEPENYTPKNLPITQKDAFVNDILSVVSDEARDAFRMKINEAIAKHSRLVDLNTSRATKEYISQARREAERVKSDDFIYKYGPILALIVAGLFAYLIIDGSIKAYQTTMASQGALMENGYRQIVEQCGGVFKPINPPKNDTQTKPNTGVQLPFLMT